MVVCLYLYKVSKCQIFCQLLVIYLYCSAHVSSVLECMPLYVSGTRQLLSCPSCTDLEPPHCHRIGPTCLGVGEFSSTCPVFELSKGLIYRTLNSSQSWLLPCFCIQSDWHLSLIALSKLSTVQSGLNSSLLLSETLSKFCCLEVE